MVLSLALSLAAATAPAAAAAPALPACAVVLDLGTENASLLATPELVAVASSCCDPALEPGTNGIPFCFEGHTCCADGQWRCNNSDGTPGCTACGGTCGLSGATCSTGADCCSGVCKGNHKCK
jgi:hypothetical protein